MFNIKKTLFLVTVCVTLLFNGITNVIPYGAPLGWGDGDFMSITEERIGDKEWE